MNSAFQYTIDSKNIARLVFNLPGEKVNKFSLPILEELEKILDELSQNKEVKALVITSGKEDNFIAGADLHSFEPAFENPAVIEDILKAGHRVFNKLNSLPFPSIAVIHGACLGGGLELALACTFRLASDHPKTILGLPEVTLGIIPGWGGTQRLPRLVGLTQGLELVLSGKIVPALKAWKIKLVDSLAAWQFLPEKTEEFIQQAIMPQGKTKILERRERRGLSHFLLEKNGLGRMFVFNRAKQDVLKKTKGFYPAPLLALDVIERTFTSPLQEGLDLEVQALGQNIGTKLADAKNLVSIFFTSEALKKDKGVPEGIRPVKIREAGVLGAGTMGGAIAWLFSYHDYPARFKDINWEAIAKGYAAAQTIYAKLIKIKKLKPGEANLKFHHLSGTVDYSGFKSLDIVIEAAVENLDLKHQILNELEKQIRPDAIIGSNTSSLTIAEMAKGMSNPERLVGMHFFNPPNRMPLVEVIKGPQTSDQTVATAVDICKKLGKTPLVVGDCPGFLVNRIFVLAANEVMWMLEEGVDFQRLEKMMLDFGMPMSPFVLADEVGNDVAYKVCKVFENAYGSRMQAPRIVESMYEHKLLGKKVGKGFFIYGRRSTRFNPEVKTLLGKLGTASKEISDQEMIDRVMLVMVNEASRCLEEKVVANPGYLDMALILGIGFPPFRGGLLRYADKLGLPYINNTLKRLQGSYGARFEPSSYLLQMEKGQKKFYEV